LWRASQTVAGASVAFVFVSGVAVVGVLLVTVLFAMNVVLRLVWREMVRGQHHETAERRYRREIAPTA
jgi:membrane protein YdbS with pleckstrin-like domain